MHASYIPIFVVVLYLSIYLLRTPHDIPWLYPPRPVFVRFFGLTGRIPDVRALLARFVNYYKSVICGICSRCCKFYAYFFR
jgi:hypothetical protein